MKQPTMNDDLKKYRVFVFHDFLRAVVPTDEIKSTANYNHATHHLHHFIEKTIRKNSPEAYAKIEHLQKLILVPAQMNYDLSSGMSDETFYSKWGIAKRELIYRR